MNYKFFVFIPVFAFLSFFSLECTPSKDGGVFLSLNGGNSWQQKVFVSKKVNIAVLNVLTIKIDPQNSKIIYLGSKDSGLWKSLDGGEVWYQLVDTNKALNNRANVYSISIDPKNTNNIYIGVYQDKYGRFLRSRDAGRSWQEVYVTSRQAYAVFATAVDSYDPSVVYMGTAEGGFLKSLDYGSSWRVIKWFDDVITDIKINPRDTRMVYLSTLADGIFKTTDKGETWQSLKENLKDFREADKVETLIIDPQNPNILYSGSEYGLLKTLDGGQTWQKVNIIIPPQTLPILSVVVDPTNNDHIYYGAGSVVYRSLDGGKNWNLYPLPSSRQVKAITIDQSNPNIIYIGMNNK